MSYPPSVFKTWVTGEVLTAADLNSSMQVIPNSNIPEDIDDYSTSTSEMRTTTDPYPSGTPSLPTSLDGELTNLRYQILGILGSSVTYWYEDAPLTLTQAKAFVSYRRPVLTYISATTIDVENNTSTANETKIIFPDGTSRSVTEDTSSTHKYRRAIITATAEFTSGTEDSGVRSGISEATNTWYAVYAVKSVIDTTKFVLAMDTTLPIRTNFSTLDSRYGSNSWVYLGLIRNGDNDAATGDILSFSQSSDGLTIFTNSTTGNTSFGLQGLLVATTASAATLTYSPTRGTGTTDLPNNIDRTGYQTGHSTGATNGNVFYSGGTKPQFRLSGLSGPVVASVEVPDGEGVNFTWTTAVGGDITLSKFHDKVLGTTFGGLL